jgi:protein-disulfide isomerase
MSSTDDSDAINALLADIAQSATALGEPAAPVTLEYFGDLQCPYCRDFSLDVLPAIIRRWVQTGKLRIESRALQAATRDPDVFVAQRVAALAAGVQDKMWYFVETFYAEQGEENSGYVTETFLEGLARQIPHLDVPRWVTDRKDPELDKQIATDTEAAANAGLTGTPSFLLGAGEGAMRPFCPTDQSSFDAAIEGLAGA